MLLPLAGSRDAAARPALERAREGVADARDCVSTAQRALALSAGVRRAESGDSNRTERSGGGSPLGEERGGAGALAARELERLQVAEMRGGSAAVQASLGALSSPRALRGGPERRHTAAVWKGRRVRRRSVGEGAREGGGGGGDCGEETAALLGAGTWEGAHEASQVGEAHDAVGALERAQASLDRSSQELRALAAVLSHKDRCGKMAPNTPSPPLTRNRSSPARAGLTRGAARGAQSGARGGTGVCPGARGPAGPGTRRAGGVGPRAS